MISSKKCRTKQALPLKRNEVQVMHRSPAVAQWDVCVASADSLSRRLQAARRTQNLTQEDSLLNAFPATKKLA